MNDDDAGSAEKSTRGFGGMDEAKQRAISRKGGRVAHEKGTAHEWTSAEAHEAGKKGGKAVSEDRAHMAKIGARGGAARGRRNAATKAKADTENK